MLHIIMLISTVIENKIHVNPVWNIVNFLTYNLLGIYSVIYNNQQVYDVCSGNLAPWPGFHFL